ncbi:MAG: glycosyl hydrolase family 28-related protein [Planctomycetota bacterium]
MCSPYYFLFPVCVLLVIGTSASAAEEPGVEEPGVEEPGVDQPGAGDQRDGLSGGDLILVDAVGFESGKFQAGENTDARLIGQADWVSYETAGGPSLIVTRNRALSGKASIRSLSSKKSAAALWLKDLPTQRPLDLNLRFMVGSVEDDTGSFEVGLTGNLSAQGFVGVRRDGSKNRLVTLTTQDGKLKSSNSVKTQSGINELSVTVRLFGGEADDKVALQTRPWSDSGDAPWQTVSFDPGQSADAEGFVSLTRDVPGEGLYVYLRGDGRNYRRAVRLDDLKVSAVAARLDAEPGFPNPALPGAAAAGQPENVNVLSTPRPPTAVSDGRYPADMGVIDVTQPPYSAAGDGVTDDTAAIQKALDDFPSANRIIYLPAGTYLVSDTLRWGAAQRGREQKRTTLEGAGPGETSIRLADRAAGFNNPDRRKSVIWTGDKPAQRFRNGIRNLTVNTGSGNPGASGIQFNTSNQGSVDSVVIRSEDGRGVAGLDLFYTGEIGNGLIRRVVVEGFDYGVRTKDRVNGMTFVDLTLREQRIAGIHNLQQVLSIENLKSSNAVPVIRNLGGGCVVVLGGVFEGLDDAKVAIENEDSTLYVRALELPGYRRAIRNRVDGKTRVVSGSVVDEFVSHEPIRPLGQATPNEYLPIKPSPDPADLDLASWVSPDGFGAVGDGKTDDTAAMQAAVDSGAKVLYLPNGRKYRIDGKLILRHRVERMTGGEGQITGKGTIVVADGEADQLTIDRIEWGYGGSNLAIEHEGDRTLVIRHAMLPRVVGLGRGDLFLDDVSNHKWRKKNEPLLELRNPEQSVWCRNLNSENYNSVKLINHGAKLWILGYKTENHHQCLRATHGGQTEVYGAHIYAQNRAKQHPAFAVDNAGLTLAGVRQYTWKPTWYEDFVAVRSGDREVVIRREEVPFASSLPLLVVPSP